MLLTPRSRRIIRFWLQMLFWGATAILVLTLGLMALLSRDLRFVRGAPLPVNVEQKK